MDATGGSRGVPEVGRSSDGALLCRAISRARQGDSNALRFLYVCFARSAEDAADEVSRDTAAAKRLVRNTFMQLPSSIRHYPGEGAGFEAWLIAQIQGRAATSSQERKSRAGTY
jgi:hypothetical protein